MKASEAGFLNEPVYPSEVPMSTLAGFKWVFTRSVALDLLTKHLGTSVTSLGFHTLTNDELSKQLINAGVLYPEYLGGVVDDGQPNGQVPV